MKIKTSANDTLYSKIIRKERPICEACHSRSASQVHHFFSRGRKSTRFCDDNIVSCCFPCHRKFHENPTFAVRFMEKRLGEEGLELLELKSNSYHKLDNEMINISLKKRRTT